MSDSIFYHEDEDSDALTLVRSTTRLGALYVHTDRSGARQSVRLERGDVRSLRDALNRWLDEQQRNDPNPAGRPAINSQRDVVVPEPIYTALVRRLVAEEVARVLPLHQSPQAALRCDYDCSHCHGDDEDDSSAAHEYATNTDTELCTTPGCELTKLGMDRHAEHDPEPKAVGHPEAPAVDWSDKLFGKAEYPEGLKFDYCVVCGHSWGAHGFNDHQDWVCTAQLGKSPCGCTRQRGGECPECGRRDGHKLDCTRRVYLCPTCDHPRNIHTRLGCGNTPGCACKSTPSAQSRCTAFVHGSGYTDCTCLDQT